MTTLHSDLIRDQFTRQAIPYSQSAAMADRQALQLLVDFSKATPTDTVLDVACGPGLVAAAFAKAAKHVTGIDLTPAIVDRAREYCREQALSNVRFEVGDVEHLLYENGTYSLVISRFAFHHFERPQAVLNEMMRCCKPGGRILLVDAVSSDDPVKAAAHNAAEKLRDPSHVAFRPVREMAGWLAEAELKSCGMTTYPVNIDLEAMLARSFPEPGDADRVRKAFAAAAEHGDFGIEVNWEGDTLHISYTAVALMAVAKDG